jgi:hypothetical protein
MLNYFCFHISLPHSQIWVNLPLMDLQLHHKIGKENTASSYTNQLTNNNNKAPQISKSIFGLFCNIRIIVPCLLRLMSLEAQVKQHQAGGFYEVFRHFFGSKNLFYTFSFCRRLGLSSWVSPYCSLWCYRPPEYTRFNIGGNMWNV